MFYPQIYLFPLSISHFVHRAPRSSLSFSSPAVALRQSIALPPFVSRLRRHPSSIDYPTTSDPPPSSSSPSSSSCHILCRASLPFAGATSEPARRRSKFANAAWSSPPANSGNPRSPHLCHLLHLAALSPFCPSVASTVAAIIGELSGSVCNCTTVHAGDVSSPRQPSPHFSATVSASSRSRGSHIASRLCHLVLAMSTHHFATCHHVTTISLPPWLNPPHHHLCCSKKLWTQSTMNHVSAMWAPYVGQPSVNPTA